MKKVDSGEARILEIGRNGYKKCNESAHIACLTNPISQPSLEIITIPRGLYFFDD
jgi:hypothetical protein